MLLTHQEQDAAMATGAERMRHAHARLRDLSKAAISAGFPCGLPHNSVHMLRRTREDEGLYVAGKTDRVDLRPSFYRPRGHSQA